MNEKEKLRKIGQQFGIEIDVSGGADASVKALEVGLVSTIDSLLPHAASFAGVSASELSSRVSAKGLVSSKIVNAYTSSNDGWKTFDIWVNLGLTQCLFQVCKLLVSNVGFTLSSTKREKPTHSSDRVVDAVKEVYTAFFSGEILSHIGIPLSELSNNQVALVSALLQDMKKFVISHEFGHFIINTSTTPLCEMQFMRSWVERLMAKEPHLSMTQKAFFVDNWSEELAADLIGLKILCRSAADQGMAVTSCETFFVCLYILENFYRWKEKKDPPAGTHPPARVRLGTLRGLVNTDTAKPLPPGARPLGHAIEDLAETLVRQF